MNYHKILPFMAAFIAFNVAFAEQIITDGSRFASDKSAIKRACLQLPEDADFQTCLDCERLNRTLIDYYELGQLIGKRDRLLEEGKELWQTKTPGFSPKIKKGVNLIGMGWNILDCKFQTRGYISKIRRNKAHTEESFSQLMDKFVDPSKREDERKLFTAAIDNALYNRENVNA